MLDSLHQLAMTWAVYGDGIPRWLLAMNLWTAGLFAGALLLASLQRLAITWNAVDKPL